VAHPEHLPRYGAPLWLAADPEDRRGGEPLITLRGYFAGLPVEAVIRAASRAPHSVDVTQVRGTLRGFSQRFTIESGDDGTVLGCRVEADPGIPMLSDEAAKHFLTQYVERMLDRLRLAAERRAPSRRPARPQAREAADATTVTEAGDAAADEAITAAEPVDPDRGPADIVPVGTIAEPASPPERTVAMSPAPRPARRPVPPRGPRPPHSRRGEEGAAGAPQRAPEAGASAMGAVPPGRPADSDAGPPGQGRRRRRRRRRGRGTPGSGAAGGETA
jgi:hypothetical protein